MEYKQNTLCSLKHTFLLKNIFVRTWAIFILIFLFLSFFIFPFFTQTSLCPIFLNIFAHICTSWSKSMALLSLDPQFDFTIYAIQVCYFVYSYLKLHINLLEVGENKRRQNIAMPRWGSIHHRVIWECHLRSIKWTMLFLEKNFQNSKLLRCEIGKMTLF